MANKVIWKAVLNDEGVPQFPEGAYGRIRLWVEGEKPIPTDTWILFGDFKDGGKSLKQIGKADVEIFDGKVNKILSSAKANLSDYGKNEVTETDKITGDKVKREKVRTFHMDIQVPKELIDGYSD